MAYAYGDTRAHTHVYKMYEKAWLREVNIYIIVHTELA